MNSLHDNITTDTNAITYYISQGQIAASSHTRIAMLS